MSYMDEKVVAYLAGPIKGCTDEEAHGWRDYIKERMKDDHIEFRNPMLRDYRGYTEFTYEELVDIVEGDKDDIYQSDIVLVHLDRISTGTIMEIMFSAMIGRYIIIVDRTEKDTLSPWILYHANVIVKNIDDAISEVRNYINGGYLERIDADEL